MAQQPKQQHMIVVGGGIAFAMRSRSRRDDRE